ncbi:hypothetical protein [Torque teno midi virus 13]|uniref:Hepatitis TT virus Orf2/Gyrovirus Vp2 N-terminal domain-containing protein n=2 Tax=Torque teno midi virus 13 TaxID=2065054 RepID=A7VM01_9VIRU|nr:hypothetical protein [Torque teno midi virus 13]BAF76122.1 hypothetical protein [Torque teno midi virus 13]
MSKLCSTDFYKKTPFNPETQTQIWMSQLADGHDNFCHCNSPFAHLLASIFPPGHKDRDLTINQILKRDYIEQCRSTGEEGENSGGEKPDQGGGFKGIEEKQQEEEEEDLPEKELIDMLAAAAEDDTRFRDHSYQKKKDRPGALDTMGRPKRNPNMSPGTLQKKYLPRRNRGRSPQAHTAAAPAAAGAQVEHPQGNIRNKTITKSPKATNRLPKLTPFKPGFERDTEEEMAKAFFRPARLFKEDPPFYPWLPRPVPLVNFHLNFKF